MDTIISILITLLASVVFAVVATVLGCLLAGLDRKVTARMQGRVGPPLLQPYYDVRKLFSKENTAVNTAIGTYVFWLLSLPSLLVVCFSAGEIFCFASLLLRSQKCFLSWLHTLHVLLMQKLVLIEKRCR